MITYDMSRRDKQPKYEYLYQCIRKDIRSGTLAAHEKLPSKRSLSQHLSISISTVEQAYDMLVSEGYIMARRGSGYFVSPHRAQGSFTQGAAVPAVLDLPFDFRANRCSLDLFPTQTWARIMRKTLSDKDEALFETIPFNGLLVLRQAIASWLREFKGMEVNPDRIVVGAGTEYLYSHLMRLLGRGTVAATGSPGYLKLMQVASTAGTLWDYIPVDDDGIRVKNLADSPADVVHVSPANHFPMGAVMPEKRRRQLLDWAHERPQRYIIEDDYDSELRYAGKPLPSLFTQDTQGRVVYLNTFSKTMVPSIRISYMVLPDTLMDLYRRQLSFYSCTVSSFEQYALAEFINGGYFERHVNRLRRYYGSHRCAVAEALQSSDLSSISHVQLPNVGTHLLLSVNTKLSDSEVKSRARKLGMEIAMLSDYCAHPVAVYAHRAIINFATIPPDRVQDAIDLLTQVFRDDIDDAHALVG